MDAMEFIRERNRMCNAHKGSCARCPANGNNCLVSLKSQLCANEQVNLVEQWSKKHPRKTRQSVFLEQYPEAWTHADGVLSICPNGVTDWHRSTLGTCIGVSKACKDCRREFWMQEVE